MADIEEELLLLVYRRCWPVTRRAWVHEILKKRQELGEFHRLVQELRLDQQRFIQYFRMSSEAFDNLLRIVGPHIRKQTANYRKPISPEQRLAICLRFLVTGNSFKTIGFTYRVGASTVGNIVEETCEALWVSLVNTHMKMPTEDEWKTSAEKFKLRWNFPNCVGAIDGKHICFQAPPNSDSLFFNYKGTFSLVLMALVDADYCFLAVDIGSYGSNSDGGIFANSLLGQGLATNQFNLPPPASLPGSSLLGPMPYVIVGDEAFPLKPYLLRPYPGKNLPIDKRVFNYRLSRARRISENAFGILAQRWRVFQSRINLHPSKCEKVVKACCILHNYLQKLHCNDLVVNNDEQRNDQHEVHALEHIPNMGCRASRQAYACRDKFKAYFCCGDREVPWQYTILQRGTAV